MQAEFRTLLRSAVPNTVVAYIEWDKRPQGVTKPAAVLSLISDGPDYHAQGPSGLVASRVQIDVWALEKTPCYEAARAIESYLSGLKAALGNVKFTGVFKDSGSTGYEKVDGGQLFRERQDFIIWHGRTA